MKFGLFYELQLPKPGNRDNWNPEDEHRIYHEMLEQVELADKVGFDYVFEVEHHFLEEYSHSSAPELMMAALSQRTRNIRLGHGIVLTPPRYNHPARVAERIAALDILSGGRVEFGSGESASEMEMGGFGVERRQKKAMWEEATREVANMMVQTPYAGFEGEFFSMPPRNVIPKPVQKPHPPLWVAASRRETTMVAARLGMGSLGFGFETPEELGERAREYYRLVREELMPIGHAINPALAVLNTFMMAETDEEAMRRSANGPAFFSYSLGYYYNPAVGGGHRPGQANVYRDFLNRSGETASVQAARGGFLSGEEIASSEPGDEIAKALYRAARSGNAIGSADTIRRTLLKYEAQNLDVMIFVAQCGDRKHAHIMESIERFGRDVLPEFRDRHVKQKAWRAAQLAGVDFPINSSI
ncbi:MAG TPA: LLM class flavin-dependent oxidoreductase [Caulobacteraceae bacterium]|jgi:alkanesulfonate monooxygenase SsuD/methylene tetrahydromethanopterin reductase-like flavin-dependent oxidoreductase (luciferase family)|nr:LLM class flavin-dependent oxidoreductase [Caulobacteraceae bacterium]